jgi:apolipoprotein N-acyltransferase
MVTPESALPIFWNDIPRVYKDRLFRHAQIQKADMMLGVVEYQQDTFYNSLVNIGVSGTQVYRKIHLVPFGEYVPWRPLTQWFMNLVNIPLTDFSAGSKTQPPLSVQGLNLAPGICYEDAFPDELRPRAKRSHLLINVSNDAWFGASCAPFQHLQIAQARALEFAKPLVRVTNQGPSALTDDRGHLITSIAYGKTQTLTGQVTVRTGMTPYAFWGNIPIMILWALWICGQFCGYLRKICG